VFRFVKRRVTVKVTKRRMKIYQWKMRRGNKRRHVTTLVENNMEREQSIESSFLLRILRVRFDSSSLTLVPSCRAACPFVPFLAVLAVGFLSEDFFGLPRGFFSVGFSLHDITCYHPTIKILISRRALRFTLCSLVNTL